MNCPQNCALLLRLRRLRRGEGTFGLRADLSGTSEDRRDHRAMRQIDNDSWILVNRAS